MPELLGRFTRMVELQPLGREELESILEDVVDRNRTELATDGLDLVLSGAVLKGIVEGALRRGHGARGLTAEVMHVVEDVVYQQAKGGTG
jgi:ATP-dependent protease Clp ATPase subunit